MEQLYNLIDGRDCAAQNGRTLTTQEPATGHDFAMLPDSDGADVEAAVAAAKNAFPAWAAATAEARARCLRRLAELIDRDLERLAHAESRDCGKPLHVARTVDIARARHNFSFFADAATQFASESHSVPGQLNYTLRQPLGPVACIAPWNLPLYLLTWKIAPALAAGCTVVAKPSEVTPYTAYLLGKLSIEAGFPPGVLNIVHGAGDRAGAALVSHPDIKAVSFTGSTRVGAGIAAVTAGTWKKLSLELGGKNASVIFDDADLDLAVSEVTRAAFANQGQICLCGSRILVQAGIYEAFKARLIARTEQLRVGDPLDGTSDLGALVSAVHFAKVTSAIARARDEGGTILCGGSAIQMAGRCADGWFVAPTLIDGLGPACATNQEEIFGPVATLLPFADEAEAIAIANGTPYGLAADVWTRDVSRAHRVAERLHAGIVWLNCWMVRDLRTPFGGVKASGVGREGGWEAMRFFTEAKSVTLVY